MLRDKVFDIIQYGNKKSHTVSMAEINNKGVYINYFRLPDSS
jgi:hypothetical protein